MSARKVAIEVRKQGDSGPGTYCLRSTFPPRPNSGRVRPYRQRLYTGIQATKENKKRVTALARRVEATLLDGTFDWADFEEVAAEETNWSSQTVGQMLPHFKRHLDSTRGINQLTWKKNYFERLRVRPGFDAYLTPETLESVLSSTTKSSNVRRANVMALRVLCEFAGVEFDFNPWVSTYSPSSVKPIDIPPDEVIEAFIDAIPKPHHKWVVGAIATWGLRPHEVWELEVEKGSTRCEVQEDTKTGRRLVPALKKEWVERWQLDEKLLPDWSIPIDEPFADVVTHAIGQILRRRQFGFTTYSLRHAWAIRCFRRGIPHGTAAKCLGHSVEVHLKSYSRWITEAQVLESFEEFT